MPYSFGVTSFRNFVWLDSGLPFADPAALEVEMVNSGAFGVEILRLNWTLAGKAQRSNPNGGWATFDFKQGGEFGPGIPDGVYRIRLTNLSLGTRKAKSGTLWFAG
jgi:hypothetical protein